MIKSELVSKLSSQNEISHNIAEIAVNEIFTGISDTLISGGRVEIRGFGSFEVRKYDSYLSRNPKTGESIKVNAKKSPFFKVGKELRERVDKKVNVVRDEHK
jgi:integration host factor subunit beta